MTDGANCACSFLRFPGRITRLTITNTNLLIEEGRYHLALPLDSVIQEVAYGFLGIQGLFITMQVGEKIGYFHFYSNLPSRQKKLASFHEALESTLGSFRSFRESLGFGFWSYAPRSVFHSWKKLATKSKRA